MTPAQEDKVYKIRPLDWRITFDKRQLFADCVGGLYLINRHWANPNIWITTYDSIEYGSIEEAKAAAEAHYRERLTQCLEEITC